MKHTGPINTSGNASRKNSFESFIFGALFQMVHDSHPSQIISWFIPLISFLQLLSFSITPLFKWDPQIIGWLMSFLQILRGRPETFSFTMFLAFFFISFGISLVFTLGISWIGGGFSRAHVAPIYVIKSLRILTNVVVVLFIPIINILFIVWGNLPAIFNVVISESLLIALRIISVFSLLLIFPISFLTVYVYHNSSPVCDDVASRTSGLIDVLIAGTKTTLVIISSPVWMIEPQQLTLASGIVMVFLFALLLGVLIITLPYYKLAFDMYQGSLFGILLFAAALSLVNYHYNASSNILSIVFLAAIPVLILFFSAFIKLRIKRVQSALLSLIEKALDSGITSNSSIPRTSVVSPVRNRAKFTGGGYTRVPVTYMCEVEIATRFLAAENYHLMRNAQDRDREKLHKSQSNREMEEVIETFYDARNSMSTTDMESSVSHHSPDFEPNSSVETRNLVSRKTLDVIDQWYHDAKSSFVVNGNSPIHIWYSSFLESYKHDYKAALAEIRTIDVSHAPFSVRFLAFAKERESEQAIASNNLGEASLGTVRWLEFKSLLRDTRKDYVSALRAQQMFWDRLLSKYDGGGMDLSDLPGTAVEAYTLKEKTRASFDALLQRFPNSPHLLRSYGSFLLVCGNEQSAAETVLSRADDLETVKSRVRGKTTEDDFPNPQSASLAPEEDSDLMQHFINVKEGRGGSVNQSGEAGISPAPVQAESGLEMTQTQTPGFGAGTASVGSKDRSVQFHVNIKPKTARSQSVSNLMRRGSHASLAAIEYDKDGGGSNSGTAIADRTLQRHGTQASIKSGGMSGTTHRTEDSFADTESQTMSISGKKGVKQHAVESYRRVVAAMTSAATTNVIIQFVWGVTILMMVIGLGVIVSGVLAVSELTMMNTNVRNAGLRADMVQETAVGLRSLQLEVDSANATIASVDAQRRSLFSTLSALHTVNEALRPHSVLNPQIQLLEFPHGSLPNATMYKSSKSIMANAAATLISAAQQMALAPSTELSFASCVRNYACRLVMDNPTLLNDAISKSIDQYVVEMSRFGELVSIIVGVAAVIVALCTLYLGIRQIKPLVWGLDSRRHNGLKVFFVVPRSVVVSFVKRFRAEIAREVAAEDDLDSDDDEEEEEELKKEETAFTTGADAIRQLQQTVEDSPSPAPAVDEGENESNEENNEDEDSKEKEKEKKAENAPASDDQRERSQEDALKMVKDATEENEGEGENENESIPLSITDLEGQKNKMDAPIPGTVDGPSASASASTPNPLIVSTTPIRGTQSQSQSQIRSMPKPQAQAQTQAQSHSHSYGSGSLYRTKSGLRNEQDPRLTEMTVNVNSTASKPVLNAANKYGLALEDSENVEAGRSFIPSIFKGKSGHTHGEHSAAVEEIKVKGDKIAGVNVVRSPVLNSLLKWFKVLVIILAVCVVLTLSITLVVGLNWLYSGQASALDGHRHALMTRVLLLSRELVLDQPFDGSTVAEYSVRVRFELNNAVKWLLGNHTVAISGPMSSEESVFWFSSRICIMSNGMLCSGSSQASLNASTSLNLVLKSFISTASQIGVVGSNIKSIQDPSFVWMWNVGESILEKEMHRYTTTLDTTGLRDALVISSLVIAAIWGALVLFVLQYGFSPKFRTLRNESTASDFMLSTLPVDGFSRPLITWHNRFSVGVRRFDEQHKILFQLMNSLYQAMMLGKSSDAIDGIIDGLLEYTVVHFGSEETMFDRFRYPRMVEHIEMHGQLVHTLMALVKAYRASNEIADFELLAFLKRWLIQHIAGDDKKYSVFFNSNGLK